MEDSKSYLGSPYTISLLIHNNILFYILYSFMLNPDFQYITCDLETTGLDTKKDEPIQIGIVSFDHHFKVLDTFQSLIKPKKNIKELKEIVRRVTGFQLEDLEHVPDITELIPQIQHFFTGNTIIIGHNIWFDIAILQRYLDVSPKHQIDTFPLSKTFFHFQPSYALDVLNQQLQKKGEGRTGEGSAHDALYDSFASMMLFKYCVTRLTKLRHHYLLLDYVLQESIETWKEIIQRTEKPYKFEQKKLFFPALKSYHSHNKKIVSPTSIDFSKHKEKKYYVGASNFKTLLQDIDRSKEKYIISFTHRSKVSLAQSALDRINIAHSTLHDHVIFDPSLVNAFLQKKSFTDAEVAFVSKYFSQYDAGHNMIDSNSLDDYKIFQSITKRKSQNKKEVILCTHLQLFQFAHKITKEHTVLFFDQERRYQNYNKWMKQPFDPLYFINLIDQLQYKHSIQWNREIVKKLNEYLWQITLFIGILSTEINKMFIWYHDPKQDIDYIIEHTRFPKTKTSFMHIQKETKSLIDQVPDQDALLIQEQRNKLSNYLSGICKVEKKMYDGDKRYYLLHHRSLYLSYEDFLHQLPPARFIFLSNSDTSLTTLQIKKDNKEQQVPFQTKTITKAKELAKEVVKKQKAQYIISSSKHKSQELFQEFINTKVQEKYTILAENITWWVGKNLYLARQSTKPIIFIWWYNFYLEALAKKFDFSFLYLYHIHGNMKEQIVHDLIYYKS